MTVAKPNAPLSQAQLDAYLDHIGLPSSYRQASQACDEALLEALHVHHITTIPYENLGLHYTQEPRISTDVDRILHKALHNGRGGYCMEGNLLYNAVLRTLGFDAYLGGARIRLRIGNVPQGPWLGWQHVVNIVTLSDGRKIVDDVAFGGDGPIKPLPLKEGVVTQNLGTQELRLAHEPLDGAMTSQRWWIYQYRNRIADAAEADQAPWNSYYCFTETEFFLTDFEVMNWFCSSNPVHFHRVTPVVVKFLRRSSDEDNSDDVSPPSKRIVGKVMLADRLVKRNTGGKTSTLVACQSDQERLHALQTYFGMTFTPDEQAGIRGRVSEITDQADSDKPSLS